jgi:hypothetical protein
MSRITRVNRKREYSFAADPVVTAAETTNPVAGLTGYTSECS